MHVEVAAGAGSIRLDRLRYEPAGGKRWPAVERCPTAALLLPCEKVSERPSTESSERARPG